MAELSEVVANGIPIRTIAVESEDAAAVVRAVNELGLCGYTNTSYPVGLAALIDGKPERYAVIDAGTNSIKFHIGERDELGPRRSFAPREVRHERVTSAGHQYLVADTRRNDAAKSPGPGTESPSGQRSAGSPVA